ncbi:sugar transferase [Microbacterium esteraromaticum]|uniref:sugar transferase n=1 Tax=Microbacterium esteraromaticum TaxID=57043 RepID=UPI0028F70F09|nr:sugar transferase [Microbacterium esteraromaticum]
MAGRSRPYDALKRVLDVVSASVAMIVLLPIMLIVAVLVAANLGRPVLFSQERPGEDERIFTLYKFRSMRDADKAKGLVTDEQRLTRFGKVLRSTSLDELPSLWNVARGDMSMVGPRPLLVEYLPLYSVEQARRHEVKPGVTGLAQVSGRNAISWEDRFALDIKYVDERSIGLDLRIVLGTLKSVIRRDGISAEGHVTMSKFGEAGDA